MAISVFTGLLFGAAPVPLATRACLSRRFTRRFGARSALAQMALSLLLLVSATRSAASRWMILRDFCVVKTFLYGIMPNDPTTIATAAAVPARRAAAPPASSRPGARRALIPSAPSVARELERGVLSYTLEWRSIRWRPNCLF
jgi:hypothetical protein